MSARSDVSDTSSDITELGQSEFPSYFEERNGHLFHSHGSSPYPLPVDTYEQQRLNGQHVLLFLFLGAHFRGPVRKVLRPRSGTQRRVLDLGTGTGQWVLDMAREFPHVKFDGLDIVPIATRYPPNNVRFEMADVNQPLRYNNGTYDLVHARSISMAVHDYPTIVNQVARVLRPGGLFLACEWGRSAEMVGGLNPAEHAPCTCQFYNMVQETLERRGIHPLARRISRIVEESGHFKRVRTHVYEMPVGDWSRSFEMRCIGYWFRETLVQYAESMGVMMVEAGRHPVHVYAVVQGFIREMYEVRGIVAKYFTVHARVKLRT
ncbi:S-adenosyl-L-methionine-dependent methyltransferase [Irpex rosettiformis]|uniref:S-adenosyl-L-methionine-dependent methyltransferase n=1 Tax=Irpex rosettiformis TaxID=378272 RepID=A0ACB8U0G7_9APHY|nr:S-adenosyl-L-methionine-dependent methyltransferase [Irpex rosettiformis]